MDAHAADAWCCYTVRGLDRSEVLDACVQLLHLLRWIDKSGCWWSDLSEATVGHKVKMSGPFSACRSRILMSFKAALPLYSGPCLTCMGIPIA